MKQLESNIVSYRLGDFIVSMEQISNTKNGAPRYQAIVINMAFASVGDWSKKYIVTGYGGAKAEAEELIRTITQKA